jgi:hypothetical protein
LKWCGFAISFNRELNTMRTIRMLATVGLTAFATMQIAQAGLIGAQVTYEYFFPFPLPISIIFSLPTQTITTSTSLVDTAGDITTTFNNNQIIITNNEASAFVSVPFNGPGYLFSGVTISNVTIDPASAPDFLGVPSFTADDIMANFAGLPTVPVGAQLILDVTSSSPLIPEPASIALLGAGLVGIGLIRRHRRSRTVLPVR